MMERWLTYDQVSLIPTQVSALEHRSEADTSVQFGPQKLSLPLIAAPMPDVTNAHMAIRLNALGSFGWIHRFQSHRDMVEDFKSEVVKIYSGGLLGVALPADAEKARTIVSSFYDFLGVSIFCIDTANGANKMVERTIKILKDDYPNIFIIAGNVASSENFYKLEEWGADAIRVGIAGGSVCETRTETGVYSPMATVIQQIGPMAVHFMDYGKDQGKDQYFVPRRKALLIADGGIKTPSDMAKALALGADLVMAGGIFAGTKESPGEVLKIDGKTYKLLRGAASYSIQQGRSEYVEGAETIVPYQGSVEKVINRFAAGLRSSMSYMNAKNLEEYRKNVKVVEIG